MRYHSSRNQGWTSFLAFLRNNSGYSTCDGPKIGELIREIQEQASAGFPRITVGDVLGIGVVDMLILSLSLNMGKILYQIRSSVKQSEA